MAVKVERTPMNIRVPVDSKLLWEAAAEQQGLTLTAWVLLNLNRRARMELREPR